MQYMCMLFTLIYYRTNKKRTPGATDSHTIKDSSTKITHNKNTIFDSVKYMLETPKAFKSKSVFTSPKTDPNQKAMEELKSKLRSFISEQTQVVSQLKTEIKMLKSENDVLRKANQG